MSMAKISKYGGPSDKTSPVQHALSRRPQLGVTKPLAGKNFKPSKDSESKKSDDEKASPQPPAQTTESLSSQEGKRGSSDAHTTDGSGQPTQSQPSASPKKATKATKKTTAQKANVRDVDDSGDDEFDQPVDLSGNPDQEDDFK
jgi:hypothetical protein